MPVRLKRVASEVLIPQLRYDVPDSTASFARREESGALFPTLERERETRCTAQSRVRAEPPLETEASADARLRRLFLRTREAERSASPLLSASREAAARGADVGVSSRARLPARRRSGTAATMTSPTRRRSASRPPRTGAQTAVFVLI